MDTYPGFRRLLLTVLPVASLIAILAPSVAQAIPTQVNVRIEGKSETLFEGPVWTEGHNIEASSDTQERPCDGANNGQHSTPGPTPTAASVDAMSIIGETFDGQWYTGYDDYLITRWGPDEQDLVQGAYWGILVNNVFTDVGGCQYELSTADEVLWAYNAFAEMPYLALLPVDPHYESGDRPLTATAELNKPFEVEVLDYADDEEGTPSAAPERRGSSPDDGADVSPVLTSPKGFEKIETASPETVVTNSEGKASITFTTPGWHRIKATVMNAQGEEDAFRSNRMDVCVPAVGEDGCGEPPIEDQPRTPPTVAEELARAHNNPFAESSSGKESEVGGHKGNSEGAGPSTTTTTTPSAPTTTTVPPTSGSIARLTVESIGPKRLLLKLTAPCTATVRIARQIGSKHHPRWRAVKTMAVKAAKAGQVEVKLPRLAAGRYRLSIGLAGGGNVVRMLTVPRRRR